MKTVKLSVNLPQDEVVTLKKIAVKRNVTMTEVIRKGIETEKYFEKAIDNGEKILIESLDGKFREVVFR